MLITLVIIGIIAAITIPTLMNNKRNEELRTGLLKAQSTLAGALDMYYIKNGERILPQFVKDKQLKSLIMPYIVSASDCNMSDCIPLDSAIYKTFNNSENLKTAFFDEGQFIMNDGMLVLIQNTDSHPGWLLISVDVNGYKKKPNRAGFDLFMFMINDKGNLIPMGLANTEMRKCSLSATGDTNGFGCTAKALSDPNYFKNLH